MLLAVGSIVSWLFCGMLVTLPRRPEASFVVLNQHRYLVHWFIKVWKGPGGPNAVKSIEILPWCEAEGIRID